MNSGLDKLMVGGAQLGMDYGITNMVGNREDSYWFDFLDYVFEQGVYKLDTAPAYQDSERRIGQWLQGDAMARKKVKITTKFPPISADEVHDERDLISSLVSSLRASINVLPMQKLTRLCSIELIFCRVFQIALGK